MRKTVLLGAAVASMMSVGFTAQANSKPTFTKDVLPILQENCQVCHRSNGANLGGMVAPMALTTYKETRPWAKSIAKNVAQRKMPPWHAAPQHHGEFANERTLTEEEISTIVNWVENGTPRGAKSDAPAPLEWDSSIEWQIGKPDLVLTMPENYFVEDDVEDLYVNFNTEITEAMMSEDRFIRAVEFKPGSAVVHHIIAQPLGGIAPGNDPTVYPEGIGQKFGPGYNVDWQMHYHKEPGPGTGQYDQSQIALKFYEDESKVTHELQGAPLGRFDFAIPAGDANYAVSSIQTFDTDTQIVSYTPHMHLRGKAARYEAIYPDGTSEVLLDVPAYDFNWQTSYGYKEFKKLPAGTKVKFTSTWDNSEANEFNPDASRAVTWGHPTTDEMSFGFMSFIDDSGDSNPMFGGGRRSEGEGKGEKGGFDIGKLIKAVDANGDGLMQKSEAPEQLHGYFAMIDANGDGGISPEEAEVIARRMNH